MHDRIVAAAFMSFMQHGFDGTSMLDIATRAKISKRDLYASFDNKHAILAATITERAQRMRRPLALPPPRTRAELLATLSAFGAAVLGEVTGPDVLAVYRLAISESDKSPEVASTLDRVGREANISALVELLTAARQNGLVGAIEPTTLATRFFALILGDLLIRLLLRVAKAPGAAEIQRRVSTAVELVIAPHLMQSDEV